MKAMGYKTVFLITERNIDGTLKGCKPTTQIEVYWKSEGYKYIAHETKNAITLCKFPIQDIGEHCCNSENTIVNPRYSIKNR